MSDRSGPLALVGGAEWTDGCDFDEELWETSGRPEVVVLPTAAAYEHPTRAVEAATRWFAGFGATVQGLMVLNRRDAMDPGAALPFPAPASSIWAVVPRCTSVQCSRTRPCGKP